MVVERIRGPEGGAVGIEDFGVELASGADATGGGRGEFSTWMMRGVWDEEGGAYATLL